MTQMLQSTDLYFEDQLRFLFLILLINHWCCWLTLSAKCSWISTFLVRCCNVRICCLSCPGCEVARVISRCKLPTDTKSPQCKPDEEKRNAALAHLSTTELSQFAKTEANRTELRLIFGGCNNVSHEAYHSGVLESLFFIHFYPSPSAMDQKFWAIFFFLLVSSFIPCFHFLLSFISYTFPFY